LSARPIISTHRRPKHNPQIDITDLYAFKSGAADARPEREPADDTRQQQDRAVLDQRSYQSG